MIFLRLFRLLFRPAPRCADWSADPLSHPAIAAMDERARADLPFDPRRIAPE